MDNNTNLVPTMYSHAETQQKFETFVWNFLKSKFDEHEQIKHTITNIISKIQEDQNNAKLNRLFLEHLAGKYKVDVRVLEQYILGEEKFKEKYHYCIDRKHIRVPRMKRDEFVTLETIINGNLHRPSSDDHGVYFTAASSQQFEDKSEADDYVTNKSLIWIANNNTTMRFEATVELVQDFYRVSRNIKKICNSNGCSHYIVEFYFSNRDEL